MTFKALTKEDVVSHEIVDIFEDYLDKLVYLGDLDEDNAITIIDDDYDEITAKIKKLLMEKYGDGSESDI